MVLKIFFIALLLMSCSMNQNFSYQNEAKSETKTYGFTSPAWSPDGNKMVFTWRNKTKIQLYLINSDGTELTKIQEINPYENTKDQYSYSEVYYSGIKWLDNKNLLISKGGYYFSYGGQDSFNVGFWLYNIENKNLLEIKNTPLSSKLELSPDNKKIVQLENPPLFICNIDGSNKIKVVENASVSYSLNDNLWSPDSSKIALGMKTKDDTKYNIYLCDADGKNLSKLVSDSFDNQMPQWSPDGNKIAFSAEKKDDKGKDYREVHIINPDGQSLINIPINIYDFEWSRDSKKILLRSKENDVFENKLYIYDIDSQKTICLNPDIKTNIYYSWSKDNKVVFIKKTQPIPEFYSVNVDGTNFKKIFEDKKDNIYTFQTSDDNSKMALTDLSNNKLSIVDINTLKTIYSCDSICGDVTWNPVVSNKIAFSLCQKGIFVLDLSDNKLIELTEKYKNLHDFSE